MYAPPSSVVSDNQLSNVTTPLSVDSSGYVITDGILFFIYVQSLPFEKKVVLPVSFYCLTDFLFW